MQVAQVRPKALFLATYVYVDGGIQRFNRTFLSACERLGVSCDVLSLGDDEQSRSRWEAPESATIRVSMPARCGSSSQPLPPCCVAATISSSSDISTSWSSLRATWFCAKSGECASCSSRTASNVWTGLDRWRLKHALRAVDRILSVSRYTRDRMRAQRPELAEERFTIFPNALSEVWRQRSARAELTEPPVEVPLPFLLSVTRLDRGDRYKGLTTVIETLAMLEDASVHYVIAGRGEDRVIHRGNGTPLRVNRPRSFRGCALRCATRAALRAMFAFVLPSGKEGFGIVFPGSHVFRAPVIAAREKGCDRRRARRGNRFDGALW